MIQRGRFHTIVDSAWGSSGKGAVACRLAELLKIQNVSSGNFPNAGHSFVDEDGFTFVSKALPTPLILNARRGKQLTGWVGPNSGFDLYQFVNEARECHMRMGRNLYVHARAAVTDQHHRDAEAAGGSMSTLAISSTMSGAGATYAMKAMRQADTQLAVEGLSGIDGVLQPWAFWQAVQTQLDELDRDFLHEVSQGFALSLDHGTHARTCTFRNCTPQQAYADFMIQPRQIGDVYLNLRTLPIRVGNNYAADGTQVGYSGDCMADQHELDWETVAVAAGFPDDEVKKLAERERTTVTKKIRRVFDHSFDLTAQSAKMCGATKLVLNFVHYLDWAAHDMRGGNEAFKAMPKRVIDFVRQLENVTGLPVIMIGTGAKHDSFVLPYDSLHPKY